MLILLLEALLLWVIFWVGTPTLYWTRHGWCLTFHRCVGHAPRLWRRGLAARKGRKRTRGRQDRGVGTPRRVILVTRGRSNWSDGSVTSGEGSHGGGVLPGGVPATQASTPGLPPEAVTVQAPLCFGRFTVDPGQYTAENKENVDPRGKDQRR